MEEGLLSLKWNNHKSTFFQVLSLLREKHAYTDVTLACEGRFYQAHKFVLSTCSEYFSDIFTSATNGTSIVIVLKDVRRQDLEYLLDYMYLGQVDVAQSELPSLIKTAECLRIKGLAIPDDEPHKIQRRSADDREGSPPPSKKKRCLQEDGRHNATSACTTNNNSTITSLSSSSTSVSGRLQMEVLPPPPDRSSLVQHLRQVPISQQSLQAPPPPPTISQGSSNSSSSSKNLSSQSQSLNLTTQTSRTSQGGTLTSSSTTAQSSHTSLSPSLTTPVPEIKEEAADPPETPESYLNESFEESETKPDVSDSRHLDPDGAIPGPSGLQGSVESWEGDGEMAGYGGGDSYPEGNLDEQGESDVQGGSWHNIHLVRPHHQHLSHQQEHLPIETRATRLNDPFKKATSTKSQKEVDTVQPEGVEDSISVMEDVGTLALNVSRPSGEPLYKTQEHSDDNADIMFSNSFQELKSSSGTQMYSEGSSLSYCPPSGLITSHPTDNLIDKSRSDPQQFKGIEGAGVSRYVCHWCSRTFDRVSNLKRHLLLHSGIKPFKCLYCDYRATQKANVVQHLANRHKDEMRALLQNNISVNDIIVPAGPLRR